MTSTRATAAVVLTDAGLPPEFIEQMLESVRVQVAGHCDVRYHVPDTLRAVLEPYVDPGRIETLVPDRAFDEAHLYILSGTALQLQVRQSTRVFVIDPHGAVVPHDSSAPPRPAATDTDQVFSRLAPPGDGFRYFPYGYTYRAAGMGPVDDFGFRITADLEQLAKRPPNHKLIACLGGSCVWSLHCLHHQMFPSVIEERLNRHCEENGLDLRFTVLNFGMPGAVELLQTMLFVQFIHGLRPDIVLAHDGYNDLAFGQISDPVLLRSRHMTYPINLEEWAQILHKTEQVPRTQTEMPYRPVNPPMAVARAYATRKRQFHQIATGTGARFVWGLQPFILSKSEPHPLETALIRGKGDYTNVLHLVAGGMEDLYGIVSRSLTPPDDTIHVNFHELFRTKGKDDFLFWDSVHLTHHGDRFVGTVYADRIIDHVFTQGLWTL